MAPLLRITEARQRAELARSRVREALERSRACRVVTLLLICTGWQLLGAALMLVSAGVPELAIAQALFAGAFAVGYGGAFFSLIYYYVTRQDRGDW